MQGEDRMDPMVTIELRPHVVPAGPHAVLAGAAGERCKAPAVPGPEA